MSERTATANFDSSELEAFKEELNQPTIKPAVESRQIPTKLQLQSDKPVLLIWRDYGVWRD